MRKILYLVFILFVMGCYQTPKINEEVEDMQSQEFPLDSLFRIDSLGDAETKFPIKYIVIHTFASKDGRAWTWAEINNLWKSYNWSRGGYHYIVQPDGGIFFDGVVYKNYLTYTEIRNGVKGHNLEAVHISWIGGWTGKDTRTADQKKALEGLVRMLKTIAPDAEVLGHSDFPGVSKSCPNFEAKKEYKEL